MAIVKMNRITVLGLAEDQADVVELLMKFGAVELAEEDQDSGTAAGEPDNVDSGVYAVSEIAAGDSDLPDEIASQRSEFINQSSEAGQIMFRLQSAIEVLDKRYPNKTGLFSDKKDVPAKDFLNVGARQDEIVERLSCLEALLEKERKISSEITAAMNIREVLLPWRGLDIDLSLSGTDRTYIFLGSVSDRTLFERFKAQIAEEAPETYIEILRENENTLFCAVVTLKENYGLINSRLQNAGFNPMPLQGQKGTPDQLYLANEDKIKDLQTEMERNQAEIRGISEHINDFRILYDFLLVRRDKLQIAAGLERTKSTFYLSGWIPEKMADSVAKALQQRFIVAVEHRPATEGEKYPILLNNNRFNSAFEVIVKMFGAPNTNEIDPTPVMAPFYFFFFGMMLSDVGYGLVLTLVCSLLLYRYKVRGELHNMCRMLMLSGISSTLCGFAFGGFFGDMVTVLSGGKVNFPVLWFNPMEDPMKLMIWSMIFGVVHLFAGMGTKIYILAKRGQALDAVFDIAPWYFIIAGLGLMIVNSSSPVGKYLALAGVTIIVLFGGRDARNPIVRLLKGIKSLYDITGYFSDILSYTRILALVLATSVIATVVNMLGFLMGPSVPGIIFFILVGLFGHSLNLCLSALSAYVHASRLQYIEFFGKFFEGGGKFYNPITLNTRYVNIIN